MRIRGRHSLALWGPDDGFGAYISVPLIKKTKYNLDVLKINVNVDKLPSFCIIYR
jgi:hypothetical protein